MRGRSCAQLFLSVGGRGAFINCGVSTRFNSGPGHADCVQKVAADAATQTVNSFLRLVPHCDAAVLRPMRRHVLQRLRAAVRRLLYGGLPGLHRATQAHPRAF